MPDDSPPRDTGHQSRQSRQSPRRPRVTFSELRDFANAQVALIRALVRVRTAAMGDLVSADPARGPRQSRDAPDTPAESSSPSRARTERRALAGRLELALARAARRGLFRPTCLVHSIALADLLARHGAPGAVIRVGVRHGRRQGAVDDVHVTGAVAPASGGRAAIPAARIEAHAWVELDGLTLDGGHGHAHTFTALGYVHATRGER